MLHRLYVRTSCAIRKRWVRISHSFQLMRKWTTWSCENSDADGPHPLERNMSSSSSAPHIDAELVRQTIRSLEKDQIGCRMISPKGPPWLAEGSSQLASAVSGNCPNSKNSPIRNCPNSPDLAPPCIVFWAIINQRAADSAEKHVAWCGPQPECKQRCKKLLRCLGHCYSSGRKKGPSREEKNEKNI